MKICVVGLGYVGLPLAFQAAARGFDVVGVDVDRRKLDMIAAGELPAADPHAAELMRTVSLRTATAVPPSEAFIICVPTPVNHDKEPDLSFVVDAVKDVARVAGDGNLVVIESTIYPGVCEEVVQPILDATGKRILLAHCPERINPGDPKWHVGNIPRVVGGVDAEATRRAADLYARIVDAEITTVSQIRAAEAAKVLENTFRDVNIAFVNEMARSFYRLDIDISEVIKAASSKPFGFMPHYPGVGVGGHCIAVDPYYMIQKARRSGFDHGFLIHARRINNEMPAFTVEIVQEELNKLGYPVHRTPVTVLGLSYKPDVSDDRESPSYDLIKILEGKGAQLTLFDPYHPARSTARSVQDALAGSVCAVIATAHREFRDNGLYRKLKLVVDGRNCLNKEAIRSFGCIYKGIGING